MKPIGYYNYTVIATYAAAISAVCGTFLAVDGNTKGAIICLLFSGLVDMFDGRIASTMKRNEAEKLFGIQIDSLCDLVSFGVLPTAIGWSLGLRGAAFIVGAALYVLNAVIRLSYFNVDETLRQRADSEGHRKIYLGCPVTAAALVFPLLFGLQRFIGTPFPTIYLITMFAVAIAFITPIKLRKPNNVVIAVFIAVGLVAAYLVFSA